MMPGLRMTARFDESSSPSLSRERVRAVRSVRAAWFKVKELGERSWIVDDCLAWSGH